MSVESSTAYRRVSAVVMAWVSIYSRGLPEEIALTRRDELLADLHDQSIWAEQTGKSTRRAAFEILLRAVKGASADLSWRRQQFVDSPAADRVISASLLGFVTVASVLMLGFATWTLVRSLHGSPQEWINAPGVLPVGVGAMATICGLVLLRRRATRSLAAIWLLGASQVLILQGIDVFAHTTTVLAWAERAIRLWPACVGAVAIGAALFYLAAAVLWRPVRERASE